MDRSVKRPNEKIIIGFGHRKRVGKDTASDIVLAALNKIGLQANKIGFADELKRISHDMFWWAGLHEPAHYVYQQEAKEKILPKLGKSPRQVWIELGNAARKIYPDVWIDLALSRRSDVLVIPDVRYPNEVDAIRAMGGLLCKIERNIPETNDEADAALAGWRGWDFVISNDGTIDELRQKLERTVLTNLGL